MDAINQMVWAVHAFRKYHRSPSTRQHVSGSIPRRGYFGRRNGEFQIAFSVVLPSWGYHLLIGLVAFLLGNLFITVIMQITFFDRRIDFACKFTQAVVVSRHGYSKCPYQRCFLRPAALGHGTCVCDTNRLLIVGDKLLFFSTNWLSSVVVQNYCNFHILQLRINRSIHWQFRLSWDDNADGQPPLYLFYKTCQKEF